MTRHLLVTNDFPPKLGGIQSYLWELWRRLDPDSFAVLTARSHPDHAAFDATQRKAGFHIERVHGRTLYFPTPRTARRVRRLADSIGATLVVLDPVLPLGLLGPRLGLPYVVVVHGAEVAIPARVPGARQLLARVLQQSSLIVSAGPYPAGVVTRAASRLPRIVDVPPGVDPSGFEPPADYEVAAIRRRFGADPEGPFVASVSRLVPRKGMDALVRASARLAPSFPTLTVAIAGAGRDRERLERLARAHDAPVRFLGRLSENDKALLLGAADVFAMACRDRWFGLEQEGFGIVFLEAASAGAPQVAGRSGGASDAVVDGVTGVLVERPEDPGEVALALRRLLVDPTLRRRMSAEGRRRVLTSFDHDVLAPRLAQALGEVAG